LLQIHATIPFEKEMETGWFFLKNWNDASN
jgi:hypothetical protein